MIFDRLLGITPKKTGKLFLLFKKKQYLCHRIFNSILLILLLIIYKFISYQLSPISGLFCWKVWLCNHHPGRSWFNDNIFL